MKAAKLATLLPPGWKLGVKLAHVVDNFSLRWRWGRRDAEL